MQQVLPPSGKTGLETRLASGFANLFISIYGSKAIGIPIVTATPGWQQLTLPDGSALLLIKYDLSLSAIIIQHCAWSSAPSAPARSNLPGVCLLTIFEAAVCPKFTTQSRIPICPSRPTLPTLTHLHTIIDESHIIRNPIVAGGPTAAAWPEEPRPRALHERMFASGGTKRLLLRSSKPAEESKKENLCLSLCWEASMASLNFA